MLVIDHDVVWIVKKPLGTVGEADGKQIGVGSLAAAPPGVNDEDGGQGYGVAELPNVLALVTYLFKDSMVAALEREIDELADDKAALDDAERAKRASELQDLILHAEQLECAAVWASGDLSELRGDADVRAILGIAGPAHRNRYD